MNKKAETKYVLLYILEENKRKHFLERKYAKDVDSVVFFQVTQYNGRSFIRLLRKLL